MSDKPRKPAVKDNAKPSPKLGGRPKSILDWEMIENACKIQCTQEEVASLSGVCLDTLQAHSKERHGVSFSEFYREKRRSGQASIRRQQWILAEKGNATMQIWLGKQYLGQADKQETKSEETINISIDQDDAGL